ncbi:MAG: outer membrane beta-barrel domain-containing protein [Bacteriovoracaceae bacterium]|jgi:outer membrane beta-barrel protein|nr:outer membrane beta-barrel domain-containing protein [Bacteriovoracaceae bacterium]
MKFWIIALLMLATRTYASEKDLYDFMWLDPDKKVYVLQNKVHKKDGTFYVNLGYGSGLSSTFQDTSLLHGNLGYQIAEEWAIEGLYTKYSNKSNDNLENIQRINGVVPFLRRPISNYGVIAKWSPFYGKINTFNKIFYFDWSFGAGLGKINTESNATTVSTPSTANTYNKESATSLIGKTQLQFHASKNFHVGLDIIMNNYQAPGPTINGKAGSDKLRTNYDALITVGFSF